MLQRLDHIHSLTQIPLPSPQDSAVAILALLHCRSEWIVGLGCKRCKLFSIVASYGLFFTSLSFYYVEALQLFMISFFACQYENLYSYAIYSNLGIGCTDICVYRSVMRYLCDAYFLVFSCCYRDTSVKKEK